MNSCAVPPHGIDLDFHSMSDEGLIAAAQSGQEWAFVELCARSAKRTFSSIYSVTRNREDAEDALQDSMLRAFKNLRQFDGRSSFATWFTRIGINSALMILRRKRSHREGPLEWCVDGQGWQQWEVGDKRANIEEHYAKKETKRDLQQAINRLRPSLRIIIEIQQSHEGSVKEIADVAGISVAAAKSRLLRARTALRRSLQSSVRSRAATFPA